MTRPVVRARGGQATPVHPTPAGAVQRTAPTPATIRDSQSVTITSVTPPKLSVTAFLDATRPQPSGGYGGWTVLQRVRRKGVLEFDGSAPFTLAVALVLDGGAQRTSIEGDCDRLEEMALTPQPLVPPPIIEVSGPFSKATANAQWVISDIAWGASLMLASGDRHQQFVTVTFLQHVSEPLASTPTRAAKAAAKNTRPYLVKAGDTLDHIAADQLGSSLRKSEILALNPSLHNDPRNVTRGMHLVLPPKTK